MEFRPDPDRPDTFIIDGVRFSGELLKAMTQPDPTRLLSFQREGDKITIFDTTQMRKDNVETIFSLNSGLKEVANQLIDERNKAGRLKKELDVTRKQVEEAALQLGNAIAEREQFKRRYQGMHDNLEKAIEKIKIIEGQLDGIYHCSVCLEVVGVKEVVCGKCVAEREAGPQNSTAPAGG